MIYVFADRPSRSARLLSKLLGAKRLTSPRKLSRGDVVINWGSSVEWAVGAKVLQASLKANKLVELEALSKKGIPTPSFSTKPKEGWLGRSLHHSHGRDFLRPLLFPAFWTKKLDLIKEYRCHVFDFEGDDIRILRWGQRLPKPGAHEWIRSTEAGWRLSYGRALPKGLRSIAKGAVRALGYAWGAVDTGITSDGCRVVLEVNSAPGLDEGGQTIQLYAEAIREMIGGRDGRP